MTKVRHSEFYQGVGIALEEKKSLECNCMRARVCKAISYYLTS